VLEAAPQSLDKNVVKGPAATVHADGDAFAFERPGECIAGELRALIAVEYLGRAMHM